MTTRNATICSGRAGKAAALALALLVADATRTTAVFAPSPAGGGVLSAQSAAEQAGEEARLFLEARSQINQEEWAEAVRRFEALRARFAQGEYSRDAAYWEAFARHRLAQSEQAVQLLDYVLASVPDTIAVDGPEYHRINDARQLRLRILGEMALEGDPRAAQEVIRQSELAIGPVPDTVQARTEAEVTAASADSALADSTQTQVVGTVDTQGRFKFLGLTPGSFTVDLTFKDGKFTMTSMRQPQPLPPHCEDASVQQEALTALMRLDIDRVEILRGVIARDDECSVNLRAFAVERLAGEETEEAQRELIALTTEHPDADTRRSAVQGLRRFDTQAAVDALVAALTLSDDSDIQDAAIQGLRRSESASALGALEAYAADASKPEDLREDAIVAMGRRSDVDAEALIRLYAALDTEDLKSALVARMRPVVESGDDRAQAWLFNLVLDADEATGIRSDALDAWSRSQSLDASRLVELHGRLSESDLRERVFYALYRNANNADDEPAKTELVRRMIELARAESDPDVRERAVYWLGRTGSTEAVGFLLELLRAPARDTVP